MERLLIMKNVLVLIYILLLLIVSAVDFRKYYIPNLLNILVLAVGIVYQGYYHEDLSGSLIGAGFLTLPFLIIYGYVSDFMNRDVIGFGDIKLVMGIGSFIGIEVLEKWELFFLLTFISASLYGIGLILFKKQGVGTKIPMAPFISLAGIVICL